MLDFSQGFGFTGVHAVFQASLSRSLGSVEWNTFYPFVKGILQIFDNVWAIVSDGNACLDPGKHQTLNQGFHERKNRSGFMEQCPSAWQNLNSKNTVAHVVYLLTFTCNNGCIAQCSKDRNFISYLDDPDCCYMESHFIQLCAKQGGFHWYHTHMFMLSFSQHVRTTGHGYEVL